MLPVYQAISFHGIVEKGGRTKPWLVVVDTGQYYKPYVVKLFETSSIESFDCVTKEVLGNLLAQQFDLPVPKPALIDMDEDFYSTIRDQRIIELLDSKDGRLKFGTEQLEGIVPFDNEVFTSLQARNMISIDSVAAFDALIRNVDRRSANPNLLVKSDEAFLIDHELSFDITDQTIREVLGQMDLPDKYFRYHLFYGYLKASWQGKKMEYFYEFEEYLKRININVLIPDLRQLVENGFSSKNHELILDYLSKMKHNSSTFVNILRGKL